MTTKFFISKPDVAPTGSTVYFIVRTPSGDPVKLSGLISESWDATHWSQYVFGGVTYVNEQVPTAFFVCTFPALAAGIYPVTAHVQAGGSPADTDEQVAAGEVSWNGTGINTSVNVASINGVTILGDGDGSPFHV